MSGGRDFDRVRRAQEKANRDTVPFEALFAAHRARLTAAVAALAPAGAKGTGRLAVLGAGNAFDLDLAALAAAFSEVHLVDIDPEALARARDRQPPEVASRLRLHAPVDLSGVLGRLEAWRRTPPTRADLDDAVDNAPEALAGALPAPFDAVASTCLVTQLSHEIARLLGEDHAHLVEVRRRLVLIHLRALAALLAPGGRALLATDFVSNETYPLDDLAADTDLTALVRELVRAGNFFFGADPLLFGRPLRHDPVLAAALTPPVELAPWLWRQTPERLFLVTAFTVTKRAPGESPHAQEA